MVENERNISFPHADGLRIGEHSKAAALYC